MEIDGQSYRKVHVDGLATYADLEATVRSLFSSSLAEEILSSDHTFREIEGILYCAESARNPHSDLVGKSISVNALNEGHFAVELWFWTDHPVNSADTSADGSGAYCVGYSRTILDHPQEVLHQFSLLDSSPLREHDDQRYLSVEHVLTWPMILYDMYDEPDIPAAYAAALDACVPKTPAEQAVPDLLRQDFTARKQSKTS